MMFRDLLLAAQSRDHEAMHKLITMYKPLITRYSFFNDSFDEDLHQEQLIRFVHCVEKFSVDFPKNVTKLPTKSVISGTSDNHAGESFSGGRTNGKKEKG